MTRSRCADVVELLCRRIWGGPPIGAVGAVRDKLGHETRFASRCRATRSPVGGGRAEVGNASVPCFRRVVASVEYWRSPSMRRTPDRVRNGFRAQVQSDGDIDYCRSPVRLPACALCEARQWVMVIASQRFGIPVLSLG